MNVHGTVPFSGRSGLLRKSTGRNRNNPSQKPPSSVTFQNGDFSFPGTMRTGSMERISSPKGMPVAYQAFPKLGYPREVSPPATETNGSAKALRRVRIGHAEPEDIPDAKA
jgi:hypothetical protein